MPLVATVSQRALMGLTLGGSALSAAHAGTRPHVAVVSVSREEASGAGVASRTIGRRWVGAAL